MLDTTIYLSVYNLILSHFYRSIHSDDDHFNIHSLRLQSTELIFFPNIFVKFMGNI